MASKLADELLKEILAPPLLVPDELFADTGEVSPFSRATYSAADALLVCKRWMRVATPALYETVIIRSTAQAQALAFALKHNPDFGRYIKKLRIEGAFGAHLGKIAPFAPNITDFCFSLALYADANVNGLVKLMVAIDPVRVLLTTAPSKAVKNKGHSEVLNTLCARIPKWTKLRTFHYSSSYCGAKQWPYCTECDIYPEIASALAQSSSLRAVHLWLQWATGIPSSAHIALAGNTTIADFYVYAGFVLDDSHLQRFPGTMRSKLRLVSQKAAESGDTGAPLSNPFYIPLHNTTAATRATIWSRILSHAVLKSAEESVYYGNSKPWFNTEYYSWKTVKSLLLVSRSFFNWTVPLLFDHLVFSETTPISSVKRYLERFQIPYSATHAVTIAGYSDDSLLDVASLLSEFTSLRSAIIPPRTSIITALSESSSSTLTQLTIEATLRRTMDISLLSRFTELVTLNCDIEYDAADSDFSGLLPADALPCLRVVRVVNGWALFKKLADSRLPMLEEICVAYGTHLPPMDLPPQFLAAHGQQLRCLSLCEATSQLLPACPRLETFEILNEYAEPSLVAFKAGHPTLQVLKLHWVTATFRRGTADETAWRVFFEAFTRSLYPSLREIRLMYGTRGIWPVNEREIKKSVWPEYAATLAAQGITLLDATGRSWRPRISRSTRR